jgi:hypothetical protein
MSLLLQFDVLFYHDILTQREFGADFFVCLRGVWCDRMPGLGKISP